MQPELYIVNQILIILTLKKRDNVLYSDDPPLTTQIQIF